MKKQHVKPTPKTRAKLAIQNNIGLITLIIIFLLFATASNMDYQDEIAQPQEQVK